MSDDDLDAFLRRLPKCEVHAHLNGSISPAVAKRLIGLYREVDPERDPPELPEDWNEAVNSGKAEDFDFAKAFAIFPLAQRLTDHPATLRAALRGVVQEFKEDGVRYLELRSTPRSTVNMTEEDYVGALVEETIIINRHEANSHGIQVRVLLSVDRRQGVEKAEKTLALALKYKDSGVIVGLDLSGDPTKGNARDYIDVLRRARDHHGLGLSVHLAEVPNEDETAALLDFLGKEDRVGHGTCIHPTTGGSHDLWEKLLKAQSPVEVCLTSNLKCGSVPKNDLAAHHVTHLLTAGHPVVICTDDKAVFRCELSSEYKLLATHCAQALNRAELFSLSKCAINQIFEGESVKQHLREQWDLFASQEMISTTTGKNCA